MQIESVIVGQNIGKGSVASLQHSLEFYFFSNSE